jgi:hypothetical protein
VNSFQSFASFFCETLVSQDSSLAFNVTTTDNNTLFIVNTSSSAVTVGRGGGKNLCAHKDGGWQLKQRRIIKHYGDL